MVLVGPDHHCFVVLCRDHVPVLSGALRLELKSFRERFGSREDLNVIVKLLLDGCPIFKRLGDRMLRVGKANRDRLLGAVTAGLNPKVVEPEIVVGARFCGHSVIAYPVTVHSTV